MFILVHTYHILTNTEYESYKIYVTIHRFSELEKIWRVCLVQHFAEEDSESQIVNWNKLKSG